MVQEALKPFHPLIQKWFAENIGTPTNIQASAWPEIARGGHLLITAPTGSGKTLTAFLWALNQLISGVWEGGATRVLYISPLKALNNDIRRNLTGPLTEIQRVFELAREAIPEIQAFTRSGDTSQSDRRKMIRHPPEILITTPESLNLMLSSNSGLSILTSLKTVILDEIHSVVDSKRGTHLITAVDRLVNLSGEFQRVALSATVKPLEKIAEFVGGHTLGGSTEAPVYERRRVNILRSSKSKKIDLRVFSPENGKLLEENDSLWDVLVPEFKKIIKTNKSTLVFVNSRKLCEHITYRINNDEDAPLAYSHHGSLSREIREEVELKLKSGELKAIVATGTLEMGIDIGALDEVLLIQCPSSISSTIQRIGRAGHQVGAVSKACLFPTHAFDSLQAAVLAAESLDPDIEETLPIQNPLDVLSQVIISMVGTETWNIDELYAFIRTSHPYQELTRTHFDLVINMLAGRYADSLVRELKPRVSIDRLENTVRARKGALLALYMSGGTIPDRGYYNLRHSENGARIGELDEEFVWEANIGKVFSIGNQHWRIERITHNDVFVQPATPRLMDIPFWKSEEFNRGFHLSEKLALFLEEANSRLGDATFFRRLEEAYQMNRPSIDFLTRFLKNQREQTNTDLPHRHHIVLEYINAGPGAGPGNQIIIHTFWGGQLNRPYALALEAAWEEKYNHRLELFPGNDSIVLVLPHKAPAEEILSLINSENFERFLRKRLESSGFFGGRFRECAGRAMLVSRNNIHERMPFWMNRLKSQKLMESVREYEDFPILLETWRTCLQDEFDLEKLSLVLDEMSSGEIRWSIAETSYPSPFANTVAWNQINKFMYLEDQALSGQNQSNLSEDLIKELMRSPDFSPEIPEKVLKDFEEKRQRRFPGYTPDTAFDLLDWLKDRLLIPKNEWLDLLEAIDRDNEMGSQALVEEMAEKIVEINAGENQVKLLCALEAVPIVVRAFYENRPVPRIRTLSGQNAIIPQDIDIKTNIENPAAVFLGQWLQFYGPVRRGFISLALGLSATFVDQAIDDLIDTNVVTAGTLLLDGSTDEICDTENLETLIRLKRRAAAPVFQPLKVEKLMPFMASFHNIVKKADSVDQLFATMESLLCFPASADLWEAEIFPARCRRYQTAWLDNLVQETELQWVGTDKSKIAFCFEIDRELLSESPQETDKERLNEIKSLIPDSIGRYSFSALLTNSDLSPAKLSEKLWDFVWRGLVANDTFVALRKGIENRFKTTEASDQSIVGNKGGRGFRQNRRSAFKKWRGTIPIAGNWFLLPPIEQGGDLIDREERFKERVRVLLDRYGIIFRELLVRELPDFTWKNVFRSLRLMELSGEILAGYFFEGIPGPQFISHQAFRALQNDIPQNVVYWMNAADPASLCGVRLEGLRAALPNRVSTTHLVFKGDHLVLISQKNGKALEFLCDPDDDQLTDYFCVIKHLLYRQFKPLTRVTIETINGDPAARSPFADALSASFETLREHRNLVLHRKTF